MPAMSARPLLAAVLLPCLACGDATGGGTDGSTDPGSTAGTPGDAGTIDATTADVTTSTAATPASSTGAVDPTTGAPDDTSDTSDTSDTGGTTDPGDEVVYPEPDWDVEPPEDHGLDAAGLMAMAAVAEDSDSNCLVVTQGGVIVGEWYWNDFGPDTDQDNVYSVTKSITSALVGIAAARGELDIDAPVGFPEWAGTDSEAIAVRNLIRNDSGREWSFNTDYLQMGVAPDQTQYAIDLGQDHPIGAWWEYNNAAIQTLERALGAAVGDLGDYAEARLFSQIHMTSALGRDAGGHPLTYQGASASCRDLARFGYLYLRGGRWAGGAQVVPAAWVAESLTPSTALNSAYGFMWWLNRPGHWVLPSTPLRDEGDGKIAPEAPDEVFAAIGAFGQLIVVDPTRDAVWVRLGPLDLGDATGTGKLEELWAAFAAAELP